MERKKKIWRTFRSKCKVCSRKSLFSKTKHSNVSVCTRCGARYEIQPDGKVKITRASDFR